MAPAKKRQPGRPPGPRVVIIQPNITIPGVPGGRPRKPRKRPAKTPIRVFVIAFVIGTFWLLSRTLGWQIPIIGSGGDSASTQATNVDPPSVSIEGSLPCRVNTSPIIQLTADRLHTCVEAKTYAKGKLVQMGQANEWPCLDQLWDHEADWSAWADNPGSSAYGIPQAIESLHGHVYDKGDWRKQVDWGFAYIGGKYKTPCAAWAFWQRTDPRPNPGNWY
jgi:hypothetical protein